MSNNKKIAEKVKDALALQYDPIGLYYSDEYPEDAINKNEKFDGCIVPLIFSGAKGKIVAFNKNNTGRDCAAFFLGYQDWIFKGIEYFLSDGVVFGRSGERFVKNKNQAKAYLESLKPKSINNKVSVFKALKDCKENEEPEIVIFFVNPDELSGLVYLLHYNSPEKDDIVITGFQSGCGSIVCLPMKYKNEGKSKAVMGMHDISVRSKLPKNMLTLTIPFELVCEMYDEMDHSFIITDNWGKIKERNRVYPNN